jgi:hypothetical protein
LEGKEMKKLLFLALIVLFSATVSGQTNTEIQDFIVGKIVEKTEGYIDETMVLDDTRIVTIVLPSYYSLDLTRIMVNAVINDYSDIMILRHWERYAGELRLAYRVADKYLHVLSTDGKKIRIGTKIK